MQTHRPGAASRLLCTLLFVQLLRGGQQNQDSRPLLVFLIDGFRYDYLDDLDALPGFRDIVNSGVKVDYMTPDFPSLSYPNYYTLMTGNLQTFCTGWHGRSGHGGPLVVSVPSVTFFLNSHYNRLINFSHDERRFFRTASKRIMSKPRKRLTA